MADLANTQPQPQPQRYEPPCCPVCDTDLTNHRIRTGIIRCRHCGIDFEATAFKPQPRRLRVNQVTVTGPIEANACAIHAKNAAVTACQRCGILICALCEINVGTGSYCPACFDGVRAEGSLPGVAGTMRDHVAVARFAVIAGALLIVVGPLFGIAALAQLAKARAERDDREEKVWTAGFVVIWILAVGEIAGGAFVDALMILAMTGALK